MFEIGTRYDVAPLPLEPSATTFFDAGAVQIGIEYRVVDEATLKAGFGDNLGSAQGFDESGLSVHVVDDRGDELLRFDCFESDAHYHYISPGSHQVVVAFDTDANGDMLSWALDAVEHRLVGMLRKTGADDLADRVDTATLAGVMPDVREFARRALQQQDSPHDSAALS